MATKPTAADVPREVWSIAGETNNSSRFAIDEVLCVPGSKGSWLVATDGRHAVFTRKHQLASDCAGRISPCEPEVDSGKSLPDIVGMIKEMDAGRNWFLVNPHLLSRIADAVNGGGDNALLVMLPDEHDRILVLGAQGFGAVAAILPGHFTTGVECSQEALASMIDEFLNDFDRPPVQTPEMVQGFLCS